MMEIPPSSVALHAFLNMRHPGGTMGRIPEPLDCSSPILDLCIRRRTRSPTPEPHNQHHDNNNTTATTKFTTPYTDISSSTVGISSPGSHADSESSEASTSSDPYRDMGIKPLQNTIKGKNTRPFKAYPKNPLTLAAAECMLSKESAEAYSEFRKQMLSHVQATHGVTNKNMRRTTQNNNNHTMDDSNYWEKRRKNNEAAKRSRDARRAKEDELAIRAAFLERENLSLRCEIANLRMELEELRRLVYRRPVV